LALQKAGRHTDYRLPITDYRFQQQVNYKINVTLDDTNHFLHADEEIEYINYSPDDLEFIYFHLWPNAYKNNKTAFAKQKISGSIMASTKFHYAREDDRGYIDSLDFRVNGQKVLWEYDPEHIDICKLFLNKPLKSGERITITTPFSVKLPHTFSRLGHVKQSYQISQWYPKPAVYDRYGWHPMPYLDQGEFYSEYGSFDVSITLPKNYVVGATGMLQNKEEIEWLEKKSAVGSRQLANSTDSIINDLGSEKPTKNGDFPPSDPEMKTLRYVQDNIHDFAWFADKRYNVLKSEVELPHSKRKVTTWLMFTNRMLKHGETVSKISTMQFIIIHYGMVTILMIGVLPLRGHWEQEEAWNILWSL